MSLADKLKRLVRIIPGISGYQDSEMARDTDKAVRMHLSRELEGIKLELEKVKTSLTERKELSLLPYIDNIASRLDKTSNLIKFASRGFSGIFDTERTDHEKIERLYAFDLELLEKIAVLKTLTAELLDQTDITSIHDSAKRLGKAIENFGQYFNIRQEI
jgi:hypothetical protein